MSTLLWKVRQSYMTQKNKCDFTARIEKLGYGVIQDKVEFECFGCSIGSHFIKFEHERDELFHPSFPCRYHWKFPIFLCHEDLPLHQFDKYSFAFH